MEGALLGPSPVSPIRAHHNVPLGEDCQEVHPLRWHHREQCWVRPSLPFTTLLVDPAGSVLIGNWQRGSSVSNAKTIAKLDGEWASDEVKIFACLSRDTLQPPSPGSQRHAMAELIAGIDANDAAQRSTMWPSDRLQDHDEEQASSQRNWPISGMALACEWQLSCRSAGPCADRFHLPAIFTQSRPH